MGQAHLSSTNFLVYNSFRLRGHTWHENLLGCVASICTNMKNRAHFKAFIVLLPKKFGATSLDNFCPVS